MHRPQVSQPQSVSTLHLQMRCATSASCSNCLSLPLQQRPCRVLTTHRKRSRTQLLKCQANAGAALTFNIAETSISFPFQKTQAQQLSKSIQDLIQTFAAKQKAERPKRWTAMEYKYKNDDGSADGLEYLEVFCNPNQYATAFDAKVLITMRSSQGLKVLTEGRLSNLKGDVDTFLEQA